MQGQVQDSRPPGGTNIQFCQKLHAIEKILDHSRGGAPWATATPRSISEIHFYFVLSFSTFLEEILKTHTQILNKLLELIWQ